MQAGAPRSETTEGKDSPSVLPDLVRYPENYSFATPAPNGHSLRHETPVIYRLFHFCVFPWHAAHTYYPDPGARPVFSRFHRPDSPEPFSSPILLPDFEHAHFQPLCRLHRPADISPCLKHSTLRMTIYRIKKEDDIGRTLIRRKITGWKDPQSGGVQVHKTERAVSSAADCIMIPK